MKNLFTLAIVFFALATNAQKIKESEVPAIVKESQERNYPKVKVTKWEKEKEGYEAEFKLNTIPTSVVYAEDGAVMSTETDIAVSELPANVNHYVKRVLGGKPITEASKILDASGSLFYKAEVGESNYVFDSNGTFVKQD